MLEIQNLHVSVWDKEILQNIDLKFEIGKNYCILGKNWSGKSSLAATIMWNPNYNIIWGDILLDSKSIKDLEANERAKLWIFLAFQNIPEIPGLKLFEFLRTIYNTKYEQNLSFLQFKQVIEPIFQELSLDRDFLWRDLNVWFSGWEKRKLEIVQIRLLKPKIIILDEVDSGLDTDSFKVVASLISEQNKSDNTFIVITHIFEILKYINVDQVIVLDEWEINQKGSSELIDKIKDNWFNKKTLP